MPKALRRSALPVLALVVVAAGSRAVLAAPAPAEPAPAVRPAATPVSTGDRAVFVPVTQKRLLNTTTGSKLATATPRAVKVTGVGGVPLEATAVVLNVAAYKPTKAGFLSVYPTGTTRPAGIGTVNFVVGQVTENVATVRVGTGGQVNVYATYATHAIVDLAGYYVSHAHDDRYLPKDKAQARTAANAFLCPTGSLIRSVAADGAPVCVQDATGPVTGVGAGLLLDNGVLSAAQGRSAQDAFTCDPGSYLQAVGADGAPTCVADKDTDTDTKYAAGPGVSIDGTTISADQRRSAANAFSCGLGQYLQAVAADGAPTCVTDKDTTYTAGPGVSISNGAISADQRRSAANAFTCPAGQYLRSVAADGTPTCATDVDTDSDTTYEPGFGLLLDGYVFSAEQGRSAKNAFTCPPGMYLQAVDADGAPTCQEDVDTDTNTTYSAGFGLLLTNGVFSAQQGRTAANAFTCSIGQFLRSVASDGTPTCAADSTGPTYTAGSGITISNGTVSAHQSRSAAGAFACPTGQALRVVGSDGAPTCTVVPSYTAGPGLVLDGMTISSAYGATVVPVRADATAAENGTRLRNAMAAVTGATEGTPYVLSLAPGTYDLGTTALTMKPYVSVVGAGRGFTTITGARVSQSGGLINLGDRTTLSGVTVRNMVNAGTSFVTAIMSNGANTARLVDVHGYASQEGGEVYGLLAFSGSDISVENSQFTVINPTAIGTGIYAISNTTVRARNVEVGHAAPGGWALHSYNASRLEFADGYANGAVRRGTPDAVLQMTHSRVDGAVTGGVQCFGAFTSGMAAATCT